MSRPAKKSLRRRLVIWFVPLITLLAVTLSGFVYWLLATEPGAQWLIRTAAHQLDGESRGVKGTVWKGLEVAQFEATLPDTEIAFSGLVLQVDWRALWQRQLHVRELSLDRLYLRLDGESEPKTDDSPFTMPELPVGIQVDRLALGQLDLILQGEPLPVGVSDLLAELQLNNETGVATIHNVEVAYQEIIAQADSKLVAHALHDPWPMQLELNVKAYATQPDSLLCADRYLPGVSQEDTDGHYCALSLQSTVEGSLDELQVALLGDGQGISLNAVANAAPKASFPLRDTTVAMRLGDDAALDFDLEWSEAQIEGESFDHVRGSLHSHNVDLGGLLANEALPAVLSVDGTYDVLLNDAYAPRRLYVDLAVAEPTSWNRQAVAGHAKLDVDVRELAPDTPFWHGYVLNDSDVSLRLGSNQLTLQGSWGLNDDALALQVDAPALSQISEALAEIGALNAQAKLGGSVAAHTLELDANYALTAENTDQIGEGQVQTHVALSGALLDAIDTEPTRWQGAITDLQLNHAGIDIKIDGPAMIALRLPDHEQPLVADVAAFKLLTRLDGSDWFVLDHISSGVNGSHWRTRGGIDPIAIDPDRIALLRRKLGIADNQPQQGGVKDTRVSKAAPLAYLTVGAEWNLAFDGALVGTASLRHVSGDVMVPLEPSFPLGLEQLSLDIAISPGSGSNSQLQAALAVVTQDMGRLEGTVQSILRYSPEQGFHVLESDEIQANLNADIDDLGWTSLFLGDAMELGGSLDAELNASVYTTGQFSSQGYIHGQNLRVVRLDDGVRLLDGELQARIDDDVFTLERLYFPAVLRVEPKEWRTATWVSENPDAQGGSLNLSGQWNLQDSTGRFVADLHRYPILQRADRYAMVTGQLNATITLPTIALSGKIVADAGWFNLDMLGGIPTIDSDIVVLRAGETLEEEDIEPPMDISMDLDVDLGPRFYLTGYGVNSGLVGQLRITMIDGALTGIGALRTRGGAIEQYGQRLQLRRGTITFQGDIANPILDIEALRTGLAVQAGVKVVGTARKPKIDLVSYPDVDHVEKLSWLLFGHGSDDSAGDIALLFSVGSSFLGGDEPFYRQFGIDEVAMRSGELGSAGSILPVESSVSGLDGGTSDVERQFLQITKQISSDITLSAQQALSDTGTVGRASYRLARGLTAELSVGTVNGIALIYRWFSRE